MKTFIKVILNGGSVLRKHAYTTVLWENDTYKGLVMEVIIVDIKVDSAWYSGLNTNNLKHPRVSLINIY